MAQIKIDVQLRNGWWVVVKNDVPTHETSQQEKWAREKAKKMAERIAQRDKLNIKRIAEGVYDLC
jgi:hypothetical protein